MPTQTVEDYLKRLFVEQQQLGDQLVPTGLLATSLGVTPGTATTMVKALARRGLVSHESHRGVRLTERGEIQALDVIRRHRIVELFLVEVLGMDWAQVHDEAEQMEHAVSSVVLERMDALLGHPTHDPHGDPIPDAQGNLADHALPTLESCAVDCHVRVERVTDDTSAFLEFIDRHGLSLGAEIGITKRDEGAQCLTLQINGSEVTIGFPAAQKIHVSAL